MSTRVNTEQFPAAIAKGLVLADFYSDSCVPCKRMSPILAQLEEEGAFALVKVNAAYEEALIEQYEIQAAPTLVFFRDGEEKARLRGAVSREDILSVLETI